MLLHVQNYCYFLHTNEIIDAIRKKDDLSTIEFREHYRNVDVLLIDDIQF